jgi:hypothetical protein
MSQLVFLVIGGSLTAIGFLTMRNLMLVARLAPGEEGYYQRQVLDRFARNQMRMLGMIVSYFGLVLFTAGLKGMMKLEIFQTISDGFLMLLWLSFTVAFSFGVIYLIVQLVRGRAIELFRDWFQIRRQQIELGSTNVFPAVTPRMTKESKVFTVIYCLLIAMNVVVSIFVR